MKKRQVLYLLFFTAGLLAQSRPDAPAQPQWASLFTGKDLSGWVEVGHEKWQIEDGAIQGQGVTKEYGYLRTEKKYVDFELFLRFKADADGNSGVFFHTDCVCPPDLAPFDHFIWPHPC